MATDYTSQINALQQSVTYTNPSAGDLAVYNAELNNGTSLATVAQQIVNASYTASVVDPIILLYQAAFGRVPDAAGLAAEVKAVQAGVPLIPSSATDTNNITFQFASSAEFQARYGVTATSPNTPALVYLLYQNILGRAPDAAGLAYWSGQTQLNAQQLLYAFSNPTTDPEYATRATAYVKSYEYDETGQAGSQAVPTAGTLFSVTINSGASNSPGSSFQFTTSIDNLTGTTGNDTFTGDNTGTTPTVTAGDAVNGLAGTDTFNYFVATGGGTVVFPQLTAVEIVNLIGGTGAEIANASAQTGITNLNLKNETVGGDIVTVGAGVNVGFDNVKVAGTETVNFAATATTGAITLLNGSMLNGGLIVTGAALTSLSLASTGAANTIAALATPTGVTSLGITADQALTITGALGGSINSIDGSSASGALKLTLGATTATTDSVKTGSGNDVVDISNVGADSVTAALGAGNDTLKVGAALGTFTTGTSLDGGDGTDIINLSATYTAANIAQVKNFETLDVSGSATTFDASLATGSGAFTTFQSDASIGGAHGAVVFTNAASGFTFTEIAAKGANVTDTSLTVTLKDATPTTDAATLNLVATDGNNDATANGQVTLGTFTATGIENITIGSTVNGIDTGLAAGSYTNTINTLTDANLTTLTITGTSGLTVTNALAAGTTANLTTVNAAGDGGNVSLDISSAVKAVNYTGSTGIDTVKIGTAGGSFYGAAGDDQVTLTANHTTAETIVFKASGDTTQTVAAGATVITAGSALESITNFQSIADANVSHDTIDLTNLAFSGVARGIDQLGALAASPNGGTFAATQANFFTDSGGVRGVAVGTFGGDTYLFVDANHDGTFEAASDIVVKLVGAHTLAAGDFAF